MKTRIVRIGNSQGIRIPKAIIDAVGFEREVEAELRGDELVLRAPKRNPREGWSEAIDALIAEHGEPEALWSDDMEDSFDAEWTWPGLESDAEK